MIVDIIIPAFNEELSLPLVLNAIPRHLVRDVIVVDNNSKDDTALVAAENRATLLHEKKQGYGAACLCGINFIRTKEVLPDIIVFLDADYSDFPEEMVNLIQPIEKNESDFVVGVRKRAWREKGAMLPQQIIGNIIATFLIRIIYRRKMTDLGPFRAIRWDKLEQLQMCDTTYGWTVEMQVKAINHNLHYTEVPVHYRKRKGVSKISGTIKGTFKAGFKIISTIFKHC